jgi:hypothetical protein
MSCSAILVLLAGRRASLGRGGVFCRCVFGDGVRGLVIVVIVVIVGFPRVFVRGGDAIMFGLFGEFVQWGRVRILAGLACE